MRMKNARCMIRLRNRYFGESRRPAKKTRVLVDARLLFASMRCCDGTTEAHEQGCGQADRLAQRDLLCNTKTFLNDTEWSDVDVSQATSTENG